MRSWNLVKILLLSCVLYSCDICNNTELTSKTKEWMQYYQNYEYSVFSNGNVKDTLFISSLGEDKIDNCSFNGDCACETISYSLVSNHLDAFTEARDHNIFKIAFRNLPNFSGVDQVKFNTEKKKAENLFYYNLELIQIEFQNQTYESLKITCDQCNEVYIKRMVISKKLGILEYEDELGNVWVKQ